MILSGAQGSSNYNQISIKLFYTLDPVVVWINWEENGEEIIVDDPWGCRGEFWTLWNIYDGSCFALMVNGEKSVTIFTKKLHQRCLTGYWICPWYFLGIIWLYPSAEVYSRKGQKQGNVAFYEKVPFGWCFWYCMIPNNACKETQLSVFYNFLVSSESVCLKGQ